MTENEISMIVERLQRIACEPISNFGTTAISLNPNNFQFKWLIENSFNKICSASIKIDSIETAAEIIHRFSNETKKEVKEGLLRFSSFDSTKPIYLQFIKDIKY